MTKASDSAAVENRGFLGQIEDFGQSTLHTAIESPINGAIQFIDHTAHAHLPELNIIGAPKHNSFGAKVGQIVGTAADIAAISVATGGVADILGGVGLTSGIATAAATGAIYGGILTPTDNNSKHFFQDRLANGGVSAATFAAMGGAASALNATGRFAVPEVRSLMESLKFGGLSGAAGGLANAEATAVLKEHKLLPSLEELATSIGTQALFGAAYGGLGYAYNRLNGPVTRPTETQSGTAKIITVNDKNGQPISFRATVPAKYDPDYYDVVWKSTKMTDGTWKSNGALLWKETGHRSGNTLLPDILNVTRAADGTVVISDRGGDIRTFAPGKYVKTNPEAEAVATARAYADHNYDRINSSGEREIETSSSGYRKLDAQGNTLEFADHSRQTGATMKYDTNGNLNEVIFEAKDNGLSFQMERTGENIWKFFNGDDVYSWQGKIQPVKDAAGAVNAVSLTPENGKPMMFNATSGTTQILAAIDAVGQYQGIYPGLSWAKVSPKGEIMLKGSKGAKLVVNGRDVTGEVTVKPSDEVNVQVDVGENYEIWEDRPLFISTTTDGKVTINRNPITERPIKLTRITIPRPRADMKE